MNNGVISKIYDAFKSQRFLKVMLCLCLSLLLASCIEVKQTININKDGSGSARMEIAIQNEVLSMPGGQQQISAMKAALQKEGWNIEGDKDVNGKHLIIAAKKFKEISELNDNETRYAFSSEKKGFMKRSYEIGVKQLKSSEMPFPYEVTIKAPGSIEETNGTKVSSGEAKWTLQGMRRGTKLSVKSSGFAMPDFASLKESFNKVFNSLFYKEAIVFLRDNNLWVMDSDGKNQKKITDSGNFLSIAVSPTTNQLACVKTDATFSNAEAQHKVQLEMAIVKEGATKKTGIYLVDVATGQEKRLVGDLPAQFGRENYGNMPVEWIDYSLLWSQDGQKLHFTRDFIPYAEKGGLRDAYILNMTDGHIKHIGPQGRHVGRWVGDEITYMDEGNAWIYNIKTGRSKDLGFGYGLIAEEGFSDGIKSADGKKILYMKIEGEKNYSIWFAEINDLNRRKLTDNATSPEWASIARVAFISPNTAKIIILVAIAVTGLLFLFGAVLMARKAVKAIIPKMPKLPKTESKPIGNFCSQCGKENAPSAKFCTGCGQRLK